MKKIIKTLLEIIEGILILCWVLYSPAWSCMLAYNAACYVNYGKVATPYVIIVIATIIYIVNIIWINRMVDKVERKEEKNG